MKKLKLISFIIVLSLVCVGCGGGKNTYVEMEYIASPVENLEKQETINKFEAEDFADFFNAYFSYTDDEIVVLNAIYDNESVLYWENLRNNYSKLIKDKLSSYLSKGLLDKIDKRYIQEEVMMPKFLLLNNYMVSGNADVEKIEIKSTRPLGENIVYGVVVTTSNNCYPIAEFMDNYTMGREENYYIRKSEGDERISFEAIDLNQIEKQQYIYSDSVVPDKMKLEQKLWITVKDSEDLEIEEIKASENWNVGAKEQNNPINTQYITRVPYDIEINKDNEELLKDLFVMIFQGGRSQAQSMRTAFDTDADAYKAWMERLGFKDKFIIKEETYRNIFSKEITPYKDEIVGVITYKEDIIIEQSVYSTKHQPRYIVTVCTQTLQKNNQVVYYNYKYYIGMEEDKIEQMQFIGVKQTDLTKMQSKEDGGQETINHPS